MDKQDKKEILEDIIVYPLSSLPVLGGTFSYSLMTGRYDGITPSYLEGAGTVGKAVVDFARYATGEQKYNEYNVRNLENAVSYLAGSPTELTRMLRHLYVRYEQNGWNDLTQEEVFEALVGKPKD